MATEVGHISGMLAAGRRQDPADPAATKLTRQILWIAGVAVVCRSVEPGPGESSQRSSRRPSRSRSRRSHRVSRRWSRPSWRTGTQTLAKAGAIVKRLRSTETLGSTSAINSDKTGTLTLNQMTAVEMAIPGRRYTISGTGYSTEGTIKRVAGQTDVPLDVPAADGPRVRRGHQQRRADRRPDGGRARRARRERRCRPVDDAGRVPAGRRAAVRRGVQVHGDVPPHAGRGGKDVVRCFVKGAPDQLLARAAMRPTPRTSSGGRRRVRERYIAENSGSQARACASSPPAARTSTRRRSTRTATCSAARRLTVLALVGIVDPPRPTAKTRSRPRATAGIQVRMITGDHAVTAEAIASELGMGARDHGAEFAAMTDDESTRRSMVSA